MIIANDDGPEKKVEAPKAVVDEQTLQEPPPTYASIQAALPPVAGPSFSAPNHVVNYVSISREHGHIRETMTIDPSLYIPECLCAPLRPGESESSRKNVRLETVHGHIDADITLIQDRAALETQSSQRATLQFASTHGGIKLTVHDHPCRPPFLLTSKTRAGDIRLTIPRTFTGPITVSYEHGEVKASALGGHFITLSEANGKMKGFIGELSKFTDYDGDGKGWKGDELIFDMKHGSVKLKFDQDKDMRNAPGDDDPSGPRRSIFSKFFGV